MVIREIQIPKSAILNSDVLSRIFREARIRVLTELAMRDKFKIQISKFKTVLNI